MMTSLNPAQPSFDRLTHGGSFTFAKLVKNPVYQYATSKFFELRNLGNELYDVLKILKRIRQL